MKTIWKYPLEVTDIQYLHLPKGADMLSLQVQGGVPCIWALVDDEELEEKEIAILMFGTGHRIYDDINSQYIFFGTFQILQDQLVFHVFYKDK